MALKASAPCFPLRHSVASRRSHRAAIAHVHCTRAGSPDLKRRLAGVSFILDGTLPTTTYYGCTLELPNEIEMDRKELAYAAVGVALDAAGCSPAMKSLAVPAANAEERTAAIAEGLASKTLRTSRKP